MDSDESSHADTSNSSEYENVHATGSVLEGQGKVKFRFLLPLMCS